MKTTVKLIALAVFCTITMNSYAQSIIVQGGFNLSKVVDLYNGNDYGFNTLPGFHVGAWYESPLNDKGLVIIPGLFYTTKGIRMKESDFGMTFKESLILNYLEIPVLFKKQFQIGNIQGYAGGGPYVSFMTHAKSKWEYTWNGETDKGSEKADLSQANRFEAGGMLSAGVEFNQVQLGIQYSLGLLTFGREFDMDQVINNSVFSITAGYRFPLN